MMKTSRGLVPTILFEDENSNLMPIHIGPQEAISIDMALKKTTMPRPSTHDLLESVLDRMAVTIHKVIIDEKVGDVYYARLIMKKGLKEMELDARPSDCVALALKKGTDIYVSKKVMDNASISKEEMIGAKSIDAYIDSF